VRRFQITFLTTALLASAGAFAQAAPPAAADTVEDLGRGIFTALQSGSFEAMEHLLPTAEDFMEIVEKEAEQRGEVTAEQLQEVLRQVPEMVAATRDKLAAEFADLLEPWREIDWSSATMKGVRINVRDPDTYEEREVDDATLAAEKRYAADAQILFETGGRRREIDLQDCSKSSRGWLVMEALSMWQ